MYKMDNLTSFRSSKDRVAQNIIEQIKKGELHGGQRIDQAAVAKREKVSLSTVRDALTVLSGKGFVECISGQGAFCKVYTISCFEKLVVIRCELEALAAKEAARNASDAEMEHLCAIAERIGELVAIGDDEGVTQEHIKFHEYLTKISGNEYLEAMISGNHLITRMVNLMLEVFESKGLVIRDYTSSHTEYADHVKLAKVIAGRNLEEIDAAVRNHLMVVIDDDMRKMYGDKPLY